MSRRDRIWIPVDVNFWDCPQVVRAGVLAGVLYQRLLGYSMVHHTDGYVPVECATTMRQGDQLPALAKVELVEVDGDEVFIPDWQKWHKLYAARAAKQEYDREYRKAQREAKAAAPEQADSEVSTMLLVEDQHQEQVQELEIATSYDYSHDSRTTVVRLFDDFWATYPRKVGKRAAQTAYSNALKRSDAESILAGLSRQIPSWTDMRFIPHPTTWLNRDGWLDQPAPPSGPLASVIGLSQAAADYEAGRRYFS